MRPVSTPFRLFALCAVVVFGAVLAGSGAARTTQAKKQFVVGFSNPTGGAASLNATQAAVIALGKHLGFKVIALDAQLNAQKQVSDINQFIAQKVDGIIVFPLAPNTLNPALKRAQKAGIKVLGWDALATPPAAGASIAPYNANMDQGLSFGGAQKLVDLVGKMLHGKGNVLGVGLGAPVPSIAFQLKQYQKLLAKSYPNMKWLATAENPTDDIAGGEKVVSEAATRFHGQINAVMSYNDNSSLGASIALRSAGVKNPVLVGEGGTPAGLDGVKSGKITASIDIVPWRQGLILATMVDRLMKGTSVPAWVENPVDLYTKANITKYVSWDAEIKKIASGALTCTNGGCPASMR
jgi:ribose transport system substrate-binding protein